MDKSSLLSHDDVRKIVGEAISRAANGSPDAEFGNTIDASKSAVAAWRNREHDMGSYHLVNALKQHPAFISELLGALGYKAVLMTDAELCDRAFTVALSALQLKHSRALLDGQVDHPELIDMEPELDEVGQGVEQRKARIRRLRSVPAGSAAA